MLKYIFLFLFLTLTTLKSFDTRFRCLNIHLLYSSYETDNINQLEEFFENWHNIYLCDESILWFKDKPNEKCEVYKLFSDIYNPYEYDNKYKNIKYAIIQNSIRFTVIPTFEKYSRLNIPDSAWVVINDFRPKILQDSFKALYLTDRHRNILNNFIEHNLEIPFPPPLPLNDTTEIWLPWQPTKTTLEFLDCGLIKIIAGHWGGYHLVTYPMIDYIKFNKDLTQAKLSLEVPSVVYDVYLIKKNEKWVITEKRAVIIY